MFLDLSVHGVKVWNNLDEELKKCSTKNQFKTLLSKNYKFVYSSELIIRGRMPFATYIVS